jgi:hypothetical protein
MMTLHLPRVTACLIDATCPELAQLALEDSLEQVSFGEVMIVSPDNFAPDARWIEVPRWKDRFGMYNFLWYELPKLLATEFVLILSWDGWVIDASCWSDEFLEYDVVGAPWSYDDGLNVGHALLRSKRIMKFLCDRPNEFPVQHPEDGTLCRTYRRDLERHGFRWPTEQVASRFAFEATRPSHNSRHFMFHSPFNFPRVLDQTRLAIRMELMRKTPYLKDDWRLHQIHNHPAKILRRLA